jgi:sugar phosphate isomerase/epimerase
MQPLSISYNRRQFIGAAVRVGFSAAATPVLLAQAVAAPKSAGWQLGCYTRPFDQFDYLTAMDAIAEAGFKYVGLMTAKAKQWVMVRADTPEAEIQTMHDEAKKRGLKILNVFGDFAFGDSLEANVAGLKRLIDYTALCESPGLMLGGIGDEKLYDLYYKVIAACCEHAAEKNIILSIKPHGGLNATGPQCRKAIERVHHKNFGLWYDPGNIFYYSEGKLDPVEDAATVDGLVVGMSIKDFRLPKEVLLNPGTGKVDFPKVFSRLKRGGFTGGPLLIECLERGELKAVTSSAARALKFLEELTA